MKNKLMICFMALIIFTSANVATVQAENSADSSIKEVYVNLDLLWKSSEKGKQDFDMINKQVEESKKVIEPLKLELQSLNDQFQKATDEKQKKEIIVNAEKKRKELITVTSENNTKIEELKSKLQNDFLTEVLPIIDNYRKEKGYLVVKRYVFGQIISLDPKVDITNGILAIYNKK